MGIADELCNIRLPLCCSCVYWTHWFVYWYDIAKIVQNDPGLICAVFPEHELFSS